MSGPNDSKYYERLNCLIESGEILGDTGKEKALKYLEEELNWPDHGGDWLAHHYNSAAEFLWDNCMAPSDKDFDLYVKLAKKEIEIFSKAGYIGEVEFMKKALNDVLSGRRAKDWE